MHVAFGRVRRKSRSVADDTDLKGFGGTWRTVKLQVNRCRKLCIDHESERDSQMKINKRILRCEYAEIVPEAYMPDFETQQRLNPGLIAYGIHQYVTGHVETEGFIFPISKDKAKYIKTASVYRVLLTKALFRQIHKLPQVSEGHRF